MSRNSFYRLAPFIQEYIYQQGWDELRAIQVQASEAILDTPNHVLITSSTASGKTEAAFLPALTELYNNPSSTIGIVYIGPLKALINDQFQRLQGLLEESDIPVQGWHGDIDQGKKRKILKQAQGVLQITPESMEAMLINRHHELGRLFGDLRFVIIDEVHAFISSDRGRQVMCQLQRLARYQANPARRIGLSATLGEPALAQTWLAGGTNLPVSHICDQTKQRNVLIGLDHFYVKPEVDDLEVDDSNVDDTAIDDVVSIEDGNPVLDDPPLPLDNPMITVQDEVDALPSLYEHMYQITKGAKSLIFANRRGDTEEIIANLRRLAELDKAPNIYHVHHGSVAAPLREDAEMAMRALDQPACISATVTLELGIDIGRLDQVLQLNATSSVSSFVQRLGRSGRRGMPAKMFFYCREIELNKQATLGQRIPWDLLQIVAIIQLYMEERWIEPPSIPHLPLSLLYHQTMSILAAHTELTPAALAEQVLTLSPFQAVTLDHYREFLRHLIQSDHVEKTETSGLIVGLAGEKLINHYHFYATFKDEIAYQVIFGSRIIGTIQSMPALADRLALAGQAWKVIDINPDKRVIFVEPARGKTKTLWTGGDIEIHGRIMQRIREILREDVDYGYLLPHAQQRLDETRQLARHSDLLNRSMLPLSNNATLLLPWQGTKTVKTLARLLAHAGLQIQSDRSPFYLEVRTTDTDHQSLHARLCQIVASPPTPEMLLTHTTRIDYEIDKYDQYIPDLLLRQAFIADRLDISGAVYSLAEMCA